MMKLRKTGFTLALFLLLSSLAGQTCLPDGITFSTQVQIDAFPDNYPDCSVIGGTVIISEEIDGTITNLQGLSQIVGIQGGLRIVHNNSLHSLGGLEQLETIEGSLDIQLNDSLTTLHGLATLHTIESSLTITQNALLNNLNGLAFLKTIGRNFVVQFNDKLVSIQGLDKLESIGGFCSFSNNSGLTHINGPQMLCEIGGFFTIQFNENLLNISGFTKLNDIGNFLGIQFNNSLELITAFSGIDTVGGFVNIQQNPLLEEIFGFENVKFIDGLLSVQYNDTLQTLNAFNRLDSISGRFNLFNNPYLSTIGGLKMLRVINEDLNIKLCGSLQNLDFLSSLEIINGSIDLEGNATLNSLSGLDYIRPDSIDLLSITGCPFLTECDVQSICSYISLPESNLSISANGTGCSDSLEIANKCSLHPICTNLTDPYDGQQNVLINTDLTWEGIPEADGYFISIGTAPSNYDMVDHLDVGDTTSYNPFNFPCLTEIYVRILPYNNEGLAFECMEESFMTELKDVDAGEDMEICEGASVQLNATGSTMVTWHPVEGLDNPFILTPNASPKHTTTYFASFNNGNACEEVDSVTVFVKDAPEANPISTHETGNDFNDGTCTCFPDSGLPPYTFEWSTGDTTQVIDSLPPGMYFITITDSNLCSKIDSVEVQPYVCPALVPFFNLKNMSCHEICDGFIYIGNVLNANQPIEYAWSNGDEDYLNDALCSGDYFLTITDAKNCSVTDSFYIMEPDILLPNLIKTDESGFQYNNGTATANPSGGTPPYSYSWSTGDDSKSITNLQPGSYSVSISDFNSCFTTAEITIDEYICPEINISSAISHASCFGLCDGNIFLDLSGGTEPYTYEWNNGHDEKNIIGVCAGDYLLMVTDSKNCSISKSFVITEPEEISLELDTVINVRVGQPGAIQISVENPSAYAFEWTGPDGFSANTEDIESLVVGCYNLTLTHLETSCSIDTVFCVQDLTFITDPGHSSNHVSFYPNPANDVLTIDFKQNLTGEFRIHVINPEGRTVITKIAGMNGNQSTIDISTLIPGTYSLVIEGEKFQARRKFIKL